MSNFIYVFSQEAHDQLVEMRYHLIKSDFERSVFIFLNKEHQVFSTDDFQYALSDTLTF